MATIRKRGKRHQAIIRKAGYPDTHKTFKHRADAVAWAAITESEMERGEFIDRSEADRTTLYEGLKRYFETVTPRKKGYKQESVKIKYWQRHKLAKTSIGRLKANDFALWRDQELKTKSPNTVRNHFVLLSHFYNHARKEWGIPIKNPFADLWWPKKKKPRKRRFVDDEEVRLHKAAADLHPLLPAAITVLTETAMRRSELTGMFKIHLDLKRGVGHLPDTKTGESRDVPLSRKAIEAFKSLPTRLDGKVWPWGAADGLSHLFKAACDKAGIKDFHLHDLRHEATSRLAKIYEVHQLAKIRGDKTLNMLMVYYHPTVEELGERLAR